MVVNHNVVGLNNMVFVILVIAMLYVIVNELIIVVQAIGITAFAFPTSFLTAAIAAISVCILEIIIVANILFTSTVLVIFTTSTAAVLIFVVVIVVDIRGIGREVIRKVVRKVIGDIIREVVVKKIVTAIFGALATAPIVVDVRKVV